MAYAIILITVLSGWAICAEIKFYAYRKKAMEMIRESQAGQARVLDAMADDLESIYEALRAAGHIPTK